jgi:hypothetical protein
MRDWSGWRARLLSFSYQSECDLSLNAIYARKSLKKSAGEGQPMKRTARMFDDRATPRSPFVVAYSPRSHPNTPTDSSLSSTLRPRFAIFDWVPNLSKIKLHITT